MLIHLATLRNSNGQSHFSSDCPNGNIVKFLKSYPKSKIKFLQIFRYLSSSTYYDTTDIFQYDIFFYSELKIGD